MIVYNEAGIFENPENGKSYPIDGLACGGTVIYNGSGTSFSHTGLSAENTYYYKAWSVDDNNYYSPTGVTSDATTLTIPPTPSGFSTKASGSNDINVSWSSPGTYDDTYNYQILLIYNTSGVGGVADKPAEGVNYAPGNTDLGGTVIYNGDAVSATSYLHENLSAGMHYYYAWHFNRFYNYSNRASSNAEPALPITLANFTAMQEKGNVLLRWETVSETENAAFRIYRDDEMVAELEGAGTTSEPHSYTWTDPYVVPSKTYSYELADVDYQGKERRHSAVQVDVKAEDNTAQDHSIGNAYPNPFNPVTVVPLNLAKDAGVHARLLDLNGRAVRELQNGTLSAGSHRLHVRSADLSAGIYFVHINVNNTVHVQKIALMK